MSDWADKAAEDIVNNDGAWYLGELSLWTLEGLIAGALRQAREEGLEECAVWVAHIGQPALADALRGLKVKYEP